jgi:hypothetical protein
VEAISILVRVQYVGVMPDLVYAFGDDGREEFSNGLVEAYGTHIGQVIAVGGFRDESD